MKSKDKFKEYYKREEVTGDYDRQREGTEYRKRKRAEERRLFLTLLNKKPKEKVLEIGCSSGWLTKDLGKVTAIDTSEDMLKITKEKNPQAKIICSDMFDLPKPFKIKTFDKIVIVRVLTHLNERELIKALKRINAVMKNGGFLVFDLEEYSIPRKIARLIYTNLFNLFRSNPIRGYKVYQYKIDRTLDILEKLGLETCSFSPLYHKVGRQLIFLCKKVRHITKKPKPVSTHGGTLHYKPKC